MSSRDKLIDKGIPESTVRRIETPQVYLSPVMLNMAVKEYSDFSGEYSNALSDYNLYDLSVDLNQNMVNYTDQHDQEYFAFSENTFTTALVVDPSAIPWIVDQKEQTSFYFNNLKVESGEPNEFIPAYRPEAVDPIPTISEIWRDAKQEFTSSQPDITVEDTFNRQGPGVRDKTGLGNIQE